VNVIGDALDEANETLNITLSNPTNAVIGTASAKGTITDDDPAPTLSISDVSKSEGNSGTTSFTFHVTLSAASGRTVEVNHATADGTATVAGNDYGAKTGTLTFNPGDVTKSIAIAVTGDTAVEPTETFSVTMGFADQCDDQ